MYTPMSFGNPFENPTPSIEKEPRILSLEEVKAKMESLIGQENFEVLRTLEDEKGVYLYEVSTVDEAGDASQYTYKRENNHPKTFSIQTFIDVAYYAGTVEDGYPYNAEKLSDYDETTGQWTDMPKRKEFPLYTSTAMTSLGEVSLSYEINPDTTNKILATYSKVKNRAQDEGIKGVSHEEKSYSGQIIIAPTVPLNSDMKKVEQNIIELFQKALEEKLSNENINAKSIELAITHLENALNEAEQIFGSTDLDDVIAREQTNIELARSIREQVKPLLNSITTQIQILSDIAPGESLRQWNPNGNLTEEQFNSLTLRRKKLRNAIGAVTKFDKTTLV